MKKRDAYHPDYLKIYPCLKERPDVLKFLKQCDRKQEYLEYDLKVNRTRTNKRTMETVGENLSTIMVKISRYTINRK